MDEFAFQFIDGYDEGLFWSTLAERLAIRDAGQMPDEEEPEEDNDDLVEALMTLYLEEFEKNGVANLYSLEDKNVNVRKNSVEILGTLGDSRAVKPLISELNEIDPSIQICAVEALGKIGSAAKEAIPALIEALNDQDLDTRRSAVRALGNIGAEAIPGFKYSIQDLI